MFQLGASVGLCGLGGKDKKSDVLAQSILKVASPFREEK